MRLKIQLPTIWAQQNNPNGPATFCRQGSSSAFQVSWAEYRGGKQPDVTTDKLKGLATDFGQKQGFGEMLESSTGTCIFGTFGTAVFSSAECPRIQIWFISDGRDHIMATHICDQRTEASEIVEAQQIAKSLALGPEQPQKPKWKFW
jgi:hypothetical protein